MSNIIDMSGLKIEKLYVISRNGSNENGRALWLCQCDCGNKCNVLGVHLRRKMVKSCGCAIAEKNEWLRQKQTKHGMRQTQVHRAWCDMKRRCDSDKSSHYKYYGGRGITYDLKWKDFINFFTDMGHPPSPQYSLDRINGNGNYTKENCRWATVTEQANNKKNNTYLTYKGKTQSIADWARELGVPRMRISSRLHRGWSIERALEEIVKELP